MKCIILSYHKNINTVYKRDWIDKYRESILNQSYKDFEIYELNYKGGEERIFENSNYESKKFETFIHAMNYLIDKAIANGADVVGNTNCDDTLHPDWLKIQLPFMAQGYDIVSSNFCLVENDTVIKFHQFDKLNIKEQLERNHNILAHPSITYSRRFIENNKYIPEELPFEDLKLWQRTIDNYRFKIVPENLLYHRIHSNSVCKSENR